MMPQKYSIIEPHPNYDPRTSYLHTGRGGAGNKVRAPSDITSGSTATGPAFLASVRSPSISSSSSRSSSHYSHAYASGRGGAGNMHPTSTFPERAIFSFDEELECQLRRDSHVAPVYHVGRGGAGNAVSSHHQPSSSSYRSGNGVAYDTYPEGSPLDRKSSSISYRDFDRASAKSDASTTGSESGADVFTRNLGKGLKKFGQVGRYITS